MRITIANQTFEMLPERALYWQEQQLLLVADTHFGKGGTFRQAGIHIPRGDDQQGLTELSALLGRINPRRCIVLGDFFHSRQNPDWLEIEKWCLEQAEAGRPLELIPGNHDILPPRDYHDAGMLVHPQSLVIDNIRLQHEPPEPDENSLYTLCGHLHPGVQLAGKGRQRMRLPCFWFGKHYGVLPAFGYFTGLSEITADENSRIFVSTKSRKSIKSEGIVVEIKP